MSASGPATPERGPECPPAVAIEALSAGEAQSARLESHVRSCAGCRGYLQALQEERHAFLRARPSERFIKQVAARRQRADRRWWWRVLALALPAAAALAVPLALGVFREPEQVRDKGARFTVLRVRGGETPQPLASDARVRAGDALRFAYAAPEEGWLLILDVDGSGAVSVFHPFGGARSARVRAGRALLEGSVVLDVAPGPEWLVALFSKDPLRLDELAAQLRGQARAPSLSVSCGGCRVDSLRMQKER